ncbi:MAG: acetolactate decarboxylase [Methanomicrobium sp.]|nr:acetolactate decarboxylase [Methanomicrobium sp.]
MDKICKFSLTAILVLLLIAGCLFTGCTENTPAADTNKDTNENRDIIWQVSSIDILLDGGYDGFVSVGELKKHGDSGIGTPGMLDGELIAVDGDFYSIKSDGNAYLLSDSVVIPFAAVTFFDNDYAIEMTAIDNISEFDEVLNQNLLNETLFYAIKIEGTFPYIKTRAVPKQEKPYQKLVDVVKKQSVFEYKNITGTVIGLWSPSFSDGMNVPGLHIHFISDDRTKGGHILDLKFDNEIVFIDKTSVYNVVLPETMLGGSSGGPDEPGSDSELALVEK